MLTVAGALSDRGHDVELVTARDVDDLVDRIPAAVGYTTFGVRHARSAIPRLAAHLRRAKPDALLAAMDHGNLAAVTAARLSRTRTPTVVSYHNHISTASQRGGRLSQSLRPAFARWVMARATWVVAVSDGVADDLRGIAPSVEERLTRIYNPNAGDDLLTLAEEPPATDIPDGEPFVLAVGRFVRQKGFDLLVTAFAELRRRSPSVRLVILGDGPQRRELEDLARRLGVEAAVSLPGVVANPYPYMVRCAAFVLSSRWEGLGNVLVEAGVLGAPLVATDCPTGPRELLEGKANAELVPSEDPPALAAAIVRALDRPRTPPDLEAWKEHTVEASVDGYERVLRRAAGR